MRGPWRDVSGQVALPRALRHHTHPPPALTGLGPQDGRVRAACERAGGGHERPPQERAQGVSGDPPPKAAEAQGPFLVYNFQLSTFNFQVSEFRVTYLEFY